MRPSDAVGAILHHCEAGSFDQLGGAVSGGGDGENPVGVAVNDQRGHVDAGEVFAEILMPSWHACETSRGRGAGCEVPACPHGLLTDTFSKQLIGVVEIFEKLGEESVTVGGYSFLDAFEDAA